MYDERASVCAACVHCVCGVCVCVLAGNDTAQRTFGRSWTSLAGLD